MDEVTEEEKYGIAGEHSLGTWARIYLHGFIAIGMFFGIAYAVTLLVPVFDVVGNRAAAIGLSVVTILAGPPILGSLILYVLFPLLGKNEAWRGLLIWDDRLLTEVSGARQRTQIVIINWPSNEVRTAGVLTATFECSETGNCWQRYTSRRPRKRVWDTYAWWVSTMSCTPIGP